MKHTITLTIRASFEDENERDRAGRLLAIAAHEATYQIERSHPGNAVRKNITGYTLKL